MTETNISALGGQTLVKEEIIPTRETVSLVIYALNEIEGLKAVLPRIKKEWVDQIVLIDGGSTDGTLEYAREHGCEAYLQEILDWEGAYMEGHKRATGDIIVDFSPDGNSLPEAIPRLIEKIHEGYDLVIASRYTGGAKSEDDGKLTAFGNWMFTGIINFLFGGKFTDSLVIYRAYRRSLLKDCGLDVRPNHQFTSLICIRCAKLGKRVADIPADEPKRVAGTSKLRPFYFGALLSKLIIKERIFWKPR